MAVLECLISDLLLNQHNAQSTFEFPEFFKQFSWLLSSYPFLPSQKVPAQFLLLPIELPNQSKTQVENSRQLPPTQPAHK
jgi:hypothetical protein